MGTHENLSTYLTNTKSTLTAIQQAYEMAGRGGLEEASSHAAMERVNAFAMTGRGNKGGRGGYPGGHNGRSAPNARWVKDGADSPEGGKSDKGSPIGAYTANKSPPAGYRRGPCNNCGNYGHLAVECRGEPADTYVEYWKGPGSKSPGEKLNTAPGKGK